MNYELAKELKEAGFRQRFNVGDKYYSYFGHPRMGVPHQWAVTTIVSDELNDLKAVNNDWVSIPTLSELIEACGGDFWELDRIHIQDEEGKMKAANSWVALNDLSATGFQGSTPEEAVARLWLALNKK